MKSEQPSTEFKPFISASQHLREFAFAPILLGILMGIIFGGSSLYLSLKIGMTVSASIPVAVLSITLFKGLSKVLGFRKTTILENNLVQTTGSAGETIAFGIAATMPALLILGYDLDLTRVLIIAFLGGLLGILMMIPLRQILIVKEHKNLLYPEGTACAEVLIAGEKGGTSGKLVFMGFFIGLTYKLLNTAVRLWKEVPEHAFSFFKGSAISAEVSPELLGVGYIIGLRRAATVFAGGVLSSFVLIPIIVLFGSGMDEPLFPGKMLIREMGVRDIWRSYILYIGAGAVATGGIISLIESLPIMIHGARDGLKSLWGGKLKSAKHVSRTARDLPTSFVVLGSVGLILALWFAPTLHINLLSSILIVCFGFLFVLVSSRLTGEVGSSTNPVSGMTVATLILTCLIFLAIGWVGPEYRVGALSIAAVVCVAAATGGTTSQDLKTGYLIGATPRNQQIGLLIGAMTSALVIGFTLQLLNEGSTIFSKKVPDYTVADISQLREKQKLTGQDAIQDPSEYLVYRVTEQSDPSVLQVLSPGKYLLNDQGKVTYLVDPGINGVLTQRDDGSTVTKFEAPKARLMSLIIDGILTQKLPWSLILLGAAIALMLELAGVSALQFGIGVYLPISTTAPMFIGGAVRWFVDRKKKAKTEVEAESESGVLFSSGMIAGGAIAGILLALIQVMGGLAAKLDLSQTFGAIAHSNLFAGLVFLALAKILYNVAKKRKV